MNDWVSLAAGLILGGIASWLITHIYHRKAQNEQNASMGDVQQKLDESLAREEQLRADQRWNDSRRRKYEIRRDRFLSYRADKSKKFDIKISDHDTVTLKNISGEDLGSVSIALADYADFNFAADSAFFSVPLWENGKEIRFHQPLWIRENEGLAINWIPRLGYPEYFYIPLDPGKTMAEYRDQDDFGP